MSLQASLQHSLHRCLTRCVSGHGKLGGMLEITLLVTQSGPKTYPNQGGHPTCSVTESAERRTQVASDKTCNGWGKGSQFQRSDTEHSTTLQLEIQVWTDAFLLVCTSGTQPTKSKQARSGDAFSTVLPAGSGRGVVTHCVLSIKA